MPTRSPFGSVVRAPAAFLISATALSDTATAMFPFPVRWMPLLTLMFLALRLVVGDGALDRVFRQHRAVDLHRRQVELLDDLRVLDRHRLIDAHPLDPFGRERRRRDRRAAAERLELGVFDDPVLVDL